MRTRKLIIIAALVLLASAAATAYAFRGVIRDVVTERARPELPPALPYVPPETPKAPERAEPLPAPTSAPTPAPIPTPRPAPAPKPVAQESNLAVPFTAQAPRADWSLPYQEACEEASLIMVNAYLKNSGAFTVDGADREILDLVEWEKTRFGYYEDTTAAEVALTAKEYYGFKNARVLKPASMEDVKAEVRKGNAVILPAAGRLLRNPYFSGAGPIYHMLVVKGFTKDGKIITNDPGTRRGADFLYDPEVLWNAIHDWNGGDVENGAKLMVVVEN